MAGMNNGNLKWGEPTGLSDPKTYVEKLAKILESWRGTPYMAGQQCRGAGVDCVRFVCAVLDELRGNPPTPIKTLPADAALHTRDGAITAMKKIRETYMPNTFVEDGSIEPGDILVVGPTNGGPGHAMIVGTKKNNLWHSARPNVHVTGLGFLPNTKVFRVYRMSDRGVAWPS